MVTTHLLYVNHSDLSMTIFLHFCNYYDLKVFLNIITDFPPPQGVDFFIFLEYPLARGQGSAFLFRLCLHRKARGGVLIIPAPYGLLSKTRGYILGHTFSTLPNIFFY